MTDDGYSSGLEHKALVDQGYFGLNEFQTEDDQETPEVQETHDQETPEEQETLDEKYTCLLASMCKDKTKANICLIIITIIAILCFVGGPLIINSHGVAFQQHFPFGENCTELESHTFIYRRFVNGTSGFAADSIAVYITAYITVTNTIKDIVFSIVLLFPRDQETITQKYHKTDQLMEVFQLILFGVLVVLYFASPVFSTMVLVNSILLAAFSLLICILPIKFFDYCEQKVNSLCLRKIQFIFFYAWCIFICLNFQIDDISLLCIYLTYVFCYAEMITYLSIKTPPNEDGTRKPGYYVDLTIFCFMTIAFLIIIAVGTTVHNNNGKYDACPQFSYFVWVAIVLIVSAVVALLSSVCPPLISCATGMSCTTNSDPDP